MAPLDNRSGGLVEYWTARRRRWFWYISIMVQSVTGAVASVLLPQSIRIKTKVATDAAFESSLEKYIFSFIIVRLTRKRAIVLLFRIHLNITDLSNMPTVAHLNP